MLKCVKEYKKEETHRFVITLKNNGYPIGSIDVVEYEDGVPVIGYCLSRKYWNQGIMTEACKAFINHLFSLGFTEILIQAHVDNIGSNKVIKKCGFTFTHVEERPCSASKPEYVRVNCYKLTR